MLKIADLPATYLTLLSAGTVVSGADLTLSPAPSTACITVSAIGRRDYSKDLPVARIGEKIERAIRGLADVTDAFS